MANGSEPPQNVTVVIQATGQVDKTITINCGHTPAIEVAAEVEQAVEKVEEKYSK